MDITVKTNQLKEKNGSTLAIANIEFGDHLKVRNVTVKEGKNGRFVSMPSITSNKIDENGQTIYNEVFNPITAKGREELVNAVLESLDTGKEITIKDNVERNGKDITARMVPLNDGKASAVGIGRLYLNEDFVVNNIVVRQTEKGGEFVTFPAYKTNEVDEQGNAIYKDFVYPQDKDSRDKINAIVMEAYKESKEIAKSEPVKDDPSLSDKKEVLKDEKPKGVKAKLKDGEAKKRNAAKSSSPRAKSKEAVIE